MLGFPHYSLDLLILLISVLFILQLLKSFAGLGPPKEDSDEDSDEDCSIMPGLTCAVQCLYEPLPQHSKANHAHTDDRSGRIICLTNLKRSASPECVYNKDTRTMFISIDI